MNFRPLGKRVLVLREEAESKTASGIILVDSAKEKPQTAVVKAIGKEVEDLKIDDRIIFEQFRGTEFTLDGVDYLVLDIEHIIGVM
ncbi:MAG: co-chaperone GroES [Campylobacterales bacterium]|nr:co-chaperone GroES [Campylobacterales bacterium]NQY20609.1 co-chaperone GroES [Campylobacteraceae bacterium]NQY51985.1 co-chaperone GroES [Campylobacteraceae bacterium]